jgi:hypothetical protein
MVIKTYFGLVTRLMSLAMLVIDLALKIGL